MKRWLAIVAIGLLAALLALLFLRPTPALTVEERTAALSAQLRCPDCQGLSVADSPTRSAQEIRRQVVELVEGGATDGGVIHLHNEGVPTVVIGVPTRHIHSHNAILCRDDYDRALALIVALVTRLDAATVAGLTA